MKKKDKKKYAPGELEKTRRNLGRISEEEARKMAKKLGGEVGVEEDPENVINKYKELKYRSYGKVIPGKNRRSRRRRGGEKNASQKSSTIPVKAGESKKKGRETPHGSFIDRIKLDFLCSKPEYQLKPLSGAIASLFSFIVSVQDKVSPGFILKARSRFYTSLHDFVTAIRTLSGKTNKEVYSSIAGNDFFSRILITLKNWDLSGIDLELNILRRQSRRLTVTKLKKLCKLIYYPFGILYDLKYDVHIKEAISWAYEINRTYLLRKGGVLLRTKELYQEALKQLEVVFTTIKRMFYPLILKMVATRFYPYDEFLVKERDAILAFLGISPGDVIQPEKIEKKAKKPLRLEKEKPEEPVETEKKKEEETAGEKDNKNPYTEGIKLLEYIYPGGGWDTLHQFPDLYPYFQPLFHFPPGFELVPRYDPLHQIIILCSIIGYLLYGFRHIEFHAIRNERLALQSIKTNMDTFLTIWPSYINDIMSKLYIARLQDYCRNIEKDPSFKKTEVAAKIQLELDYVKKMFFLPYQSFQFQRKVSLVVKKNVPKLYFITAEIRPLLEKVTEEINTKFAEKRSRELKGERVKFAQLTCESVKNPWSKIKFDLENPLSRRLDKILYKRVSDGKGHTRVVDRRSNANLIIYTTTLLSMLDYLINTKSSYFYQGPRPSSLFRSLRDDGTTPQYSVPLLDPEKQMRKVTGTGMNKKRGEQEKEKKAFDRGTQFHTQDVLDEHLIREIQNAGHTNSAFSVILFHLFPLSPEVKETGKPQQIDVPVISSLAGVITHCLRQHLDTPFRFDDDDFLIILKNLKLHEAVGIARRIAQEVNNSIELENSRYRLSAGALQFQLPWNADKLRKLINKLRLVLHKQHLSRIIFVDRDTETLKALRLK